MMKTLFIACAGLLALSLFSCKKHNKNTYSNIVGNWKVIWMAEDQNGNNTIDSNEIEYYTNAPNYSIIYSFNANGTGTDTQPDSTYHYTYTVSNDSLIMHFDALTGTAHCHLDILDATYLQFSTTDGVDMQWVKFARQ